MSLFSRTKNSECKLVFDIGSGSVGGAIVHASEENIPTILYSFRSEIPFQEEAKGARLLSLMLRSLAQVNLALLNEGFEAAQFGARRGRIREAIVSLSAPWTVSKTSLLTLQNREPVPVDEGVFAALLQRSEEELSPSENRIPKGSIQFERELVKSVLNGYETPSPYEKSAREAEFTLFRSFTPEKVAKKVSETIADLMHPRVIRLHSFAFLLFSVLAKLSPQERRFVAIDVSGEQTELISISEGVPVQTATFPLGKNRLIRALNRKTRAPPSGAMALLKLHADKSGTGKMLERVEKAITLAEAEWSNECLKALQTLFADSLLPKLFFVAADDDVMPIFLRALEHTDITRFSIAPKVFRAVPLYPDLLAPLVTWGGLPSRDPFLGLISSFARTDGA